MKAVIYDKWLHSLGGGEVVACNIAKILKNKGYKIVFISCKKVPPALIFNKLKIDLKEVEFKQVWNDETAIKELTKGSDLFINTSFMDYTIGFAKKNIYYTHFPSQAYDNLRGLLLTKIVFPLAEYFIKPFESIRLIDAPIIMKGKPAYMLEEKNQYALFNLDIGKVQIVEFELFVENLSMTVLNSLEIHIENGQILEKLVQVRHHQNTVLFSIKFLPKSGTIYLNLNIKPLQEEAFHLDKGRLYLFYPKVQIKRLNDLFLSNVLEKLRTRLRAGIFVNIQERLNTYQNIVTNSYFTQRWIKKYWGRSSTVIFPPVDLLCKRYKLKKYRKKNWICSVGRFFTLGHGKKQEILIEAFKLLCEKTNEKWELHLIGGLEDEHSSVVFFNYLKEKAKGYPIFFHTNVSRQEMEEIYLKSKIYWHATGFGEKESYQPIRFEHFGIAPVEAISAGCIPMLYNGGGLPEIIKQLSLDERMHLFTTIDQLVKNTLYFSKTSANIDWQQIFNLLEKNFSLQAFKERLLEIIASN